MTNCFIKFMNWFIKASLCVVPEDEERKKKTLWHHWNFFCSHAQLKCGSLCVTNDFTQYKSFFNYHERYTSFSLMYIEIEAHNLWIMKNGAKERKWWRWWWWWGEKWRLKIGHFSCGSGLLFFPLLLLQTWNLCRLMVKFLAIWDFRNTTETEKEEENNNNCHQRNEI